MVRTIVKGGVWKNTEDEVLKAAIAKYGKNQWARISSLLTRKTPKQCKARWYEWLDPSIKKTEWSKTEDEKLLHLAKLMPTQWRTIAPLVGRTANQCLERYQKLLDEAQAKENNELDLAGTGDVGPSADDVRKLRPGEVDPDPETKPARPDPIDMDEDEKEMLSEARARLANTQGKKAKRKARERQLEEARRLAVLQKKRELKAAGIIMRSKTKKKGMDASSPYNADIPFEKKPVPGFYDTSEEQARITAAPVGQSLRRLENKRKPDEEDAERKKRQRKDNKEEPHQTKFIAARDAQIQKLKEAESIGRRRKLVLPNAQVGEAELEDIAKIGQAGENAKALVAGGSEASTLLLSGYEGLEAAKMARTPRTAPQHDNIMLEARNLRNMTIAQTPLLGDENAPMYLDPSGGSGFEGATPRHQVAFTPNPLATPRDTSGGGLVDMTPLRTPVVGATPLRTPLRDNLSINPPDTRSRESAAKRALKAGFMNLPKPENNFELLLPDEEDADADTTARRAEDAADRDARTRLLQQQEAERALRRRSRVVQNSLPRPVTVQVSQLFNALSLAPYRPELDSDSLQARDLVEKELASLVYQDTIQHPLPGTTLPGATQSDYQFPDDNLMAQADDAINAELASMVGFPDANPSQIREGLITLSKLEDEPSSSWFGLQEDLAWDLVSRSWVRPDNLSYEQRIAGYQARLAEARELMTKEAGKAAKMEKKLNITLGGYRKLGQTLSDRLTTAFNQLQQSQIEFEAFSRLRTNESVAGPRRVAALKEEVDRLEARETRLQRRYAELVEEKRDQEARVSALEDKLMAEAEEYNEVQMASGDN